MKLFLALLTVSFFSGTVRAEESEFFGEENLRRSVVTCETGQAPTYDEALAEADASNRSCNSSTCSSLCASEGGHHSYTNSYLDKEENDGKTVWNWRTSCVCR